MMGGEEIEFSFKIEDIKYSVKGNKVKRGTNISQAKKFISKMTYIPIRELQLIEVISSQRINQGNDQFGNNEEEVVKKDDTYVLEQKDILLFGIKSFCQEQINMMFIKGTQPKPLPIFVYKNDLLINLRTKIWMEEKAQDLQKYPNPSVIKMQMGGQNYLPIQQEDLQTTVEQFINKNKINQHNGKYHLLFEEDTGEKILLMLQDQIFGTKINQIKFKSQLTSEKDIMDIIILFENFVKNQEQYERIKNNSISQPSSSSMQQQPNDSFLYQLYKNNYLEITVENSDEKRPNIKEFINGEQLTNSTIIVFTFLGQTQ